MSHTATGDKLKCVQIKRYFCSYAPRLDISLKKDTTTLKFDLDLPVAVFKTMVFVKKYFPTGSIFFRIYKFVNTGFFLEKILSHKNAPRLDILLKKIPRP